MLRAPAHRPGSVRVIEDRSAHDGRTDSRANAHRRATAGPGPARRATGDLDRARVEGPATVVGPFIPPDVLVSRELSRCPGPRLHRPLFATRGCGPRPILGPRNDAVAS